MRALRLCLRNCLRDWSELPREVKVKPLRSQLHSTFYASVELPDEVTHSLMFVALETVAAAFKLIACATAAAAVLVPLTAGSLVAID